MHHPTDRIAHTTVFGTPVVEHWLGREKAQWVYHEGSIWWGVIFVGCWFGCVWFFVCVCGFLFVSVVFCLFGFGFGFVCGFVWLGGGGGWGVLGVCVGFPINLTVYSKCLLIHVILAPKVSQWHTDKDYLRLTICGVLYDHKYKLWKNNENAWYNMKLSWLWFNCNF